MAVRVLLVDDHELIRHGLRRAFERAGDAEVVGDVGTVAEAEALAVSLRPDVVVMDIRLTDGSGLEATRRLRAAHPDLGIVVVTMYAGDEYLLGALDAGASAFVSKDAPADQVVAAARHAAGAPRSFTADGLVEAMRRRSHAQVTALTARESEVLALLADGLAVADIARRLYMSESTAKTHIAKVYSKLGASNRAQALMTAVRVGLLSGAR